MLFLLKIIVYNIFSFYSSSESDKNRSREGKSVKKVAKTNVSVKKDEKDRNYQKKDESSKRKGLSPSVKKKESRSPRRRSPYRRGRNRTPSWNRVRSSRYGRSRTPRRSRSRSQKRHRSTSGSRRHYRSRSNGRTGSRRRRMRSNSSSLQRKRREPDRKRSKAAEPPPKEESKTRSESRDSSLSYSPLEKHPERYAHIINQQDKKKIKAKKEKMKNKDKAKLMPRVRLRSTTSDEEGDIPSEPHKLSPVQYDSDARALQLLRAKAKESLEKKIPGKVPKVHSPTVESSEAEKQVASTKSCEIQKQTSPSKQEGPTPAANNSAQTVRVEDIVVPPLPEAASVTFKQQRPRDSSSGSDTDR